VFGPNGPGTVKMVPSLTWKLLPFITILLIAANIPPYAVVCEPWLFLQTPVDVYRKVNA
jgi:hypothetical protein